MVSFAQITRGQQTARLPSIPLTGIAQPSRLIGPNPGNMTVATAVEILKNQGYSRIHVLVPKEGDSFELLNYNDGFEVKDDEIAVIGHDKDTQETSIIPLRNGSSAEGVSSSSKNKIITLLHNENKSPVLTAEIVHAGNISFNYRGSKVAIDPYAKRNIGLFGTDRSEVPVGLFAA